MTAQEILELQRRRLFPELRVHLSKRTSYEVVHPEMMAVTKALVFIALPPVSEGVLERSVYCDPIHISRIEPMNGYEKRPPVAPT